MLYRHLGDELDVKNWVLELDIKSQALDLLRG